MNNAGVLLLDIVLGHAVAMAKYAALRAEKGDDGITLADIEEIERQNDDLLSTFKGNISNG
jgi:hypothetical protein